MDMAIHKPNRSRLFRNVLAASIGAWALCASPSFAFVFGEPLPQLPPIPTDGPPPIVGTKPPDTNPDLPPGDNGPGSSDPPILIVSQTPEPATLIAGLVGVGMLGTIGALKRRRQN
jgi:hypothetical protein